MKIVINSTNNKNLETINLKKLNDINEIFKKFLLIKKLYLHRLQFQPQDWIN